MEIINVQIKKTKKEKNYLKVTYLTKGNKERTLNLFNGDLVSIMHLRNNEKENDKLAWYCYR